MNLFGNICGAPTKRKNSKIITKYLLRGEIIFPIDLFSNLDIILCSLLKLCNAEEILCSPPSHIPFVYLKNDAWKHQTLNYSVIGRQQIAISSSKQCQGQTEEDIYNGCA